MKTQVLARDSLKTTNQMFTVLYDLILYVMMPIAFEMSYIKIFQRSMNAYHVNDINAMNRLIVYFAIQWFLGVLVRREYVKVSLKRITLALLILIQAKEAFFEEVLFDMLLSIAMESGLIVLLFFKFTHLVVVLKMSGFSWLMMGTLLAIIANRKFIQEQWMNMILLSKRRANTFMYRIHHCMIQYSWNRSYCKN